jgi:hypothetical protein
MAQYLFGNFRCPHTPLPTWWQGGRHGDNATISAASSPHHPGRIETTRTTPFASIRCERNARLLHRSPYMFSLPVGRFLAVYTVQDFLALCRKDIVPAVQ